MIFSPFSAAEAGARLGYTLATGKSFLTSAETAKDRLRAIIKQDREVCPSYRWVGEASGRRRIRLQIDYGNGKRLDDRCRFRWTRRA